MMIVGRSVSAPAVRSAARISSTDCPSTWSTRERLPSASRNAFRAVLPDQRDQPAPVLGAGLPPDQLLEESGPVPHGDVQREPPVPDPYPAAGQAPRDSAAGRPVQSSRRRVFHPCFAGRPRSQDGGRVFAGPAGTAGAGVASGRDSLRGPFRADSGLFRPAFRSGGETLVRRPRPVSDPPLHAGGNRP